MNPLLQRLMDTASRLARPDTGAAAQARPIPPIPPAAGSGKLAELQAVTATIQAALASAGLMPAAPAAAVRDVIDIEARVVPEPAAPTGAPPPVRSPGEAGRFIAGTCATAAGDRGYKLYIPPGAQGARPLIVMLHGCTQDPDDFATGTAMNAVAREQGCYVLYPAQSAQMNPQRCWNWFKHSHQQRGRGEPQLLASMTYQVMTRYPIDADRVYVAGLSAGGAMAAILGRTYPDLYAAVGVHSGLAPGAANDLPSALAAMQGGGSVDADAASGLPTIVFHGDADATVHPANGDQVVAASAGADAAVESERMHDLDGRACTRRVYRARDGQVVAEHWLVHGAAHAWSGGDPGGSHADSRGPDASVEMLRFFLEHPRRARN